MLARIWIMVSLLLSISSYSAIAAVILQYHHVDSSTPASTSIDPAQFEAHMQYLADNGFKVLPVSQIVDAIKHQKALPDKAVAITFDDAYLDILTNAKPILDKFDYPYTIFINPDIINRGSLLYMSWQQLRDLAEQDVIIANHGFYHDSLARVPRDMDELAWLEQQRLLLLQAEKEIEQKTGKSYRYFAYPYGEYSPTIQSWLENNDFVGFSQQSGAVGLTTSLSAIPRFPASKPYDKLTSLRDKLNSLPFVITLDKKNAETIYQYGQVKSVTMNVVVDDFRKSQLNCYVSGIGKQKVKWLDEETFTINFTNDLSPGRVRGNCTAPSISEPGRYYWYSKPWFILRPDNEWYPL